MNYKVTATPRNLQRCGVLVVKDGNIAKYKLTGRRIEYEKIME
jgi:hypothetical protein